MARPMQIVLMEGGPLSLRNGEPGLERGFMFMPDDVLPDVIRMPVAEGVTVGGIYLPAQTTATAFGGYVHEGGRYVWQDVVPRWR
jgi:hypothetical protein